MRFCEVADRAKARQIVINYRYSATEEGIRARLVPPSWKQRAQLFRNMPVTSLVAFLGGVGCLFAAINAAQDAIHVAELNQSRLLFTTVSGGLAEVLWAYLVATRRVKSLIVLVALQISLSIALTHIWPQKPQAFTPDQIRSELIQHLAVIMSLVPRRLLASLLVFWNGRLPVLRGAHGDPIGCRNSEVTGPSD